MTPTNVGMRCPECAKQRTKVVRMREMATIPRVTYALIAINVIVFLAEKGQFSLDGSGVHGFVVEEGWLWRPEIGIAHQYWRLLTGAFLHESLLHIGFNMYLLYLLGLLLEPAIGSARFAAVYFTSLLAGSFGVLLSSGSPSLGASGAIFGVLGFAAVELRSRGHSVTESGIGMLIVLNLVLTFTISGISIGAHVGGLIGGALVGFAARAADRRGGGPGWVLAFCVILSAAAVAGSIVVSAGASGTGFA